MPTGRPRIEKWENGGSSTLNGDITDSATSLTITSGTSFPSEGDFRVKIGTELITVTHISGSTWTIERGVEGTTAAAHTNGDAVTHVVTGDSLQRAAHDGFMYHGDTPLNRVQRDDTGVTLTESSFTWLNQGTATCVDADDGGLKMTMPSEAYYQVRGKYISAPSPNWRVRAFVQFGPGMARWTGSGTGSGLGLFMREASTGKLYLLQLRGDVIHMIQATLTSFVADVDTFIDSELQGVWFRLGDNNTDVFGEVSLDGSHWEVCFNEGRTTYMAGGPDQVGFFAQSGNAAAGAEFYFKSWILEDF